MSLALTFRLDDLSGELTRTLIAVLAADDPYHWADGHARDQGELVLSAGHTDVLWGRLSSYVPWSLVRDRSNRERFGTSGTHRRRQRDALGSDD